MKTPKRQLLKYAKQYFKINNRLNEGLRENDLEHLISPYVSIDEYTSKISDDNITIAFFCNEREVGSDLMDFLEKMYFIEIRDIELADTLTEDNKYIVYVELDRTQAFSKTVIDIIDSINFLINKKVSDWDFKTLNMSSKIKVSDENIKKYVRLVPLTSTDNDEKEDLKNIDEKEEIKQETVEYSLDKIKRTFLDEGVITEDEFNSLLNESELIQDSLDTDILEYNLPGKQIIATNKNIFIIGDNIRKLGYM